MSKARWYEARKLRSIEVPVTSLDADGAVLFELPRGAVDSVKVVVGTVFNTGATLDIGIPSDQNYLVAAQAIDSLGVFVCTMANYLHNATVETPITVTVSDKSVAGALRVIVNFAVDKDTRF